MHGSDSVGQQQSRRSAVGSRHVRRGRRRWGVGLVALVGIAALLAALIGTLATRAAATPLQMPAFADPAIQVVWARYDQPVYAGQAARSYTWGGQVSGALQEDYREGPSGKHLVQYFDKSRMEINDPSGDRATPFFVTQGLLAEDMILGRIQVGDASSQPAAPAQVPFGDPDDATGPTYASFAGVVVAPPAPEGQPITATIDRAGYVGGGADARGVTSTGVPPGVATNHAIASVFSQYLTQQGLVYENGQSVTAPLYNPFFYVVGLPITEAYWTTLTAAGQPRMVLIQCFERRCLTYAPSNPQGFQVEQANTGLQYYTWRYQSGQAPPLTPTPTATQAPPPTATPRPPTPTPTPMMPPTAAPNPVPMGWQVWRGLPFPGYVQLTSQGPSRDPYSTNPSDPHVCYTGQFAHPYGDRIRSVLEPQLDQVWPQVGLYNEAKPSLHTTRFYGANRWVLILWSSAHFTVWDCPR